MVACTVITVGYAAHARVLARSFLDHHPDAHVAVLVADDVSGAFGAGEPFETLRPTDVGMGERELHRRATMYDGQGLTCSLKAALVARLLDRGESPVLLLDADSCVYGDLGPAAARAERHGLVVTPHSTDPHEDHALERMIIRTGAFNSGFLAAGPGARPFLRWWDARIARHCVPEPGTGVFNEQAWLDLVPGLFPHHVLRDPGCNLSGFALHSRDVVWRDGTPGLDVGPLRHFHFLCGFDPRRPHQLTTVPAIAAHWPALAERPGVARLAREYADRLLEAGHGAAAPAPFEHLPGGQPLTPLMRTVYREAVIAAEAEGGPEPPNPFAPGGPGPFVDWLNEPLGTAERSADGATPRFLLALRAARPDLIAAFPRVPGPDAAAYVAWARTKRSGDDESIPPFLIPAAADGAPVPAPAAGQVEALEAERHRLARELERLRASRSWRFTAPSRAVARRLRRRPP